MARRSSLARPFSRAARATPRRESGARACSGMFASASGKPTVISAEELEAARRFLCSDEPGPAVARAGSAAHAPSHSGFRTGTGRSCTPNAQNMEKMRKWLLAEEDESEFKTAAKTAQRGRPATQPPMAHTRAWPTAALTTARPCRRGEVGTRRVQAAQTRRACPYDDSRAGASTRCSKQSAA